MGLDRPVLVRFGLYILRVAQGDLGHSLISNTRVVEELGEAIGPKAASSCSPASSGPSPRDHASAPCRRSTAAAGPTGR